MKHLKGERLEQAGRSCVQRRSWPCAVKNAHLRKKTEKEKRAFFDEGRDALRAVLWAVGPAPRARVLTFERALVVPRSEREHRESECGLWALRRATLVLCVSLRTG